ncbi:Kinesin-like protein Klp10A [Papilio xuthus]|uniref:Kinesin-like protein Klp10A n=1 Tax=Papilio xuthus TaxID=66420 RepID=A0A194PQZ5_PAPXU|nr:Kinesin-like protein Klp10A [Papilio xuthus]
MNELSKRTRRIHSAIVSGVNVETRSVTVEWFERGETKGKEVEIDTILALNPELIGTRRSPHLQPVSNAPNKLAREPSGSSSDEGGFLREGAEAEGDAGHTLPVRNSRSVRYHRARAPATPYTARHHVRWGVRGARAMEPHHPLYHAPLPLRCRTMFVHTIGLLRCLSVGLRSRHARDNITIRRAAAWRNRNAIQYHQSFCYVAVAM